LKHNLLNFALFQLAWFAAVAGAAAGQMWYGPAAVGAFLIIQLALIPEGRGRELAYVITVGLVGALLDSALHALGVLKYPSSEVAWGFASVPPWIISLWVAFALLPRFSLAWLVGRPRLAALLGAVGGPLSFFAGTGFGAIAPGDEPVVTALVLALEYALVTPLLLAWAPAAPDRE